jgi:AhpD family alkylhydroperoxidase
LAACSLSAGKRQPAVNTETCAAMQVCLSCLSAHTHLTAGASDDRVQRRKGWRVNKATRDAPGTGKVRRSALRPTASPPAFPSAFTWLPCLTPTHSTTAAGHLARYLQSTNTYGKQRFRTGGEQLQQRTTWGHCRRLLLQICWNCLAAACEWFRKSDPTGFSYLWQLQGVVLSGEWPPSTEASCCGVL